ncbi:DUF2491 family protein [bacterium]|nr:DUF2491 family protein [bacterium]
MFEGLMKKAARFINGADKIIPREVTPFDLHLKSNLVISTNIHTIYKSKVTLSPFTTVTAIGYITLGDFKIYRFYIGENNFLQVITDLAGNLQECRAFSVYDMLYPSTPAHWSKQIGINTGRIGMYTYSLADGTDYLRLDSWADAEDDWAAPINFDETIKMSGNEVLRSHQAMAYGRWLHEDNKIAEFLIVSSETRRNEKGYVTAELISVAVGIDINPADVNSLF